jgi:hypothetical protein
VLQEHVNRTEPRTLHIVDWEATSAPLLNRLLQAAIHVTGQDKQLYIWSSTLSEERLSLLAKNGFRSVAESGYSMPPLLVRALANDRPPADWSLAGRRLVDFGEWDLRRLYSTLG